MAGVTRNFEVMGWSHHLISNIAVLSLNSISLTSIFEVTGFASHLILNMAIFLLYLISQLSSNFEVTGPIFRVTQEIFENMVTLDKRGLGNTAAPNIGMSLKIMSNATAWHASPAWRKIQSHPRLRDQPSQSSPKVPGIDSKLVSLTFAGSGNVIPLVS